LAEGLLKEERKMISDWQRQGKRRDDGELRLSESPVNPSEKADIFLCQSFPKTGIRRE
jgi:hypothetical protein